MKKKVIFMLINMNIGGTEKALLNMIVEMPKTKYDITILMLEKYGGFLDSIPSDVHVEYVKEYPKLKGLLNQPTRAMIVDLLKNGKVFKGLSLFFVYLLTKMTNNRTIFFEYLLKDIPNHIGEYDIAVAYAGPMDFISYFVVKKIKAKRKIQWIHFDVTKIGFDKTFISRIYKHFDQIYTVSHEGKRKLVQLLPKLHYKIDSFINVISPELLLKMANDGTGFDDHFDGIRILTVGRLSKEKGQDLVIQVMAKLKQNSINVRWYCIGDGSSKEEYKDLIRKYGVEKDFILLGAKTNPYPFMKQCDIYVQPSRHEGYCLTLAEVKCFDKPIICTDFSGAKEQIKNSQIGTIVQFDEIQIYNALIKFLSAKGFGS